MKPTYFLPGGIRARDAVNDEGEEIIRVSVAFPVSDKTPSPFTGFPQEIRLDPVDLSSFLDVVELALEERFPETRRHEADMPFFSGMDVDEDDEYATFTFEVRKSS